MLLSFFLLGLVMVASISAIIGGLIVLANQNVVVDQSGHVTEVNVPLFGRLRTNYPSLVAIMLGAALAFAVIQRVEVKLEAQQIPLTARLDVSGLPDSVPVFVSAIPQRYSTATTTFAPGADNAITLEVDEPGPYNVIAYTVSGLTPDGEPRFTVVNGPAVLNAEPRGFEFTGRLSIAAHGSTSQ
jgi:hypothetical protein